jgi:hypothetical protein
LEGTRTGFLKLMLFANILFDFILGFFFLFFLPEMENILLIEPLNYRYFGQIFGLTLLTNGVIQLISFMNMERFILFPFIISIERIVFAVIGFINIILIPTLLIFIAIQIFLGIVTILSIKLSRLSLRVH